MIKAVKLSVPCVIVILILLVVGCSPSESDIQTAAAATEEARPCSEKSAEYITEIESILERWNDADSLASATSRMALSGPIETLQEIKRDAGAMKPPICAEHVSRTLVGYMDLAITSYLSFLADEPEHVINMTLLTTEAAKSSLDLDLANLKADIPKTSKTVQYIVTGDLIRYDISYRDGSGALKEIDSQNLPWFISIQADEGALLILETRQTSNRTVSAHCAIVSDSHVVDIQSESGRSVDLRCSGNA